LKPTSTIDQAGVVFDEIEVELDGTTFRGWESIRLSREMNSACGTFEISASLSHPFPGHAGARAVVRLGGLVAARGFVDDVELELSESGHSCTIGGRDKTCDLVDCSVPYNMGQLQNVYLDDIAKALSEPYGVEVDVGQAVRGDLIPRFVTNQGDTAWAALERIARLGGQLCYPTADGTLRIERPAQRDSVGSIQEGDSGLRLRWTDADRFNLYVIRGQNRGSDAGWGANVAAVQAFAIDDDVGRSRTLLVVAETAIDPQTAQERANWERTVRRARSAGVTAKVRGWRQKWNGPLWALNELVPVSIPRWGFSAKLLVDGLAFTRDEQGTSTELRLVRPDSYSPEPSKSDPFKDWADKGSSSPDVDLDEEP
jgi:prophage tail gpP-like protein